MDSMVLGTENEKELKLVQKSIRLSEEVAGKINAWPGTSFNDKLEKILTYCMYDGQDQYDKVLDMKRTRKKLISEIYMLRRTVENLDDVFSAMQLVCKQIGFPFPISKWRKVKNESLPIVKYDNLPWEKRPRIFHTTIRITEELEKWVDMWAPSSFSDNLDNMIYVCLLKEKELKQEIDGLKRMRERLIGQVRALRLIKDSISLLMAGIENIVVKADFKCSEEQEEYAITGWKSGRPECKS